jgi:hypothetical protein
MNLPTSVKTIKWKHARRIVQAHHYLGRAPAGAKFCLGIYSDSGLMGVMIFGRPVARLEDQETTLELTRMVLFDGAPKNACSRAISLAEKWIKNNRKETRLIAYADTDYHQGTIYKASNWHLIGTSKASTWARANRKRSTRRYGIKNKFERILPEIEAETE